MNYRPLTIDEFIHEFNQFELLEVLENTFTNGFCYYFAVILKEKFPRGEIIYLPVQNHFVFSYGTQYLYDIRGNVTDLYFNSQLEIWNNYNDLPHKQRIKRDCIEHDRIVNNE